MRGFKELLSAALCIGLLAACAQRPEAPAVDLAAEAEAIESRSAEWLQLALARDAAGIANGMYAPDAVTMFDGNVSRGTAEIQARMEKEMAENPDSTLAWTTNSVQVAASGDLAYELGSWTFDPDGAGAKPGVTGEYVTVWKKMDGTWRAVADAGSANLPEAPAPATGG